MNNKEQFKQCMTDIFMRSGFNIELIEKNFSNDYVQLVNQHTLNYSDFVKHIKTLKKEIIKCEIEFVTLISERDKLSSTHIIRAIKKDGSKIKAKVIGVFTFKNGKIIHTDEVTCLFESNTEDNDMGSRL